MKTRSSEVILLGIFLAFYELVPKDHFLRKVEETIDFSFIYDLVEDSYSSDNGRPSLDPVLLVKIPLIQCFYGIRSMRQTIKDIEVNTAYRWFLGLSLDDKVPHFTTYGKNYSRRFENKEVLAHIFSHVLHHVLEAGLIDPSEIFIDGTHIKAAANNHKYKTVVIDQKAIVLVPHLGHAELLAQQSLAIRHNASSSLTRSSLVLATATSSSVFLVSSETEDSSRATGRIAATCIATL